MAKLYTSLLFPFLLAITPALYAQNVGIGTSNPVEKLEVVGAIKIGTTTGNYAGTIRYNPTTNKFEGRDNTGWKEFGGSGTDDWTKVGETPNATDADEIFHTGNVGIGTSVPLAKLHVKGLGNRAIRAETSNSTDTIAAINAINTIGIAVRVQSGSAALPAIWALSDSSTAFKAVTKSWKFAAMEALNKDSAGYALKVFNEYSLDTVSGNLVPTEAGNAALFMGDVNLQGALRNSDNALYGGSVAINDGLTVGSIAGATCITSNSATKIFNYVIGGFQFFAGTSPTYSNNPTGFSGDCRKVTGFVYESTFFDFEGFPINVDLFVRNQFVLKINHPDAKLSNNPPVPGNPPLVSTWSADGGWYSKWTTGSLNYWNNTDPSGTNWFVHCVNYGSDTDYWESYKGTISYNWGNSTTAPPYAAFGDIRASGAIYSHSVNELGDIAEFFRVEKKARQPEPGDIVSISSENPQSFVLAAKPNDPLVAGVISENPSIYLNSPDEGEPIALTGRVKVKVNLEGGKIAVGDPITSSSMEGVGMKAGSHGMILGHALESFDGSRTDVGKIWILISRTNITTTPGIKIVQGKDFNLGGIMVSGAQKVKKQESSVFVQWDSKIRTSMPDDVEFDDLVIDVTPFGGSAELAVTQVNKDGFAVAVSSKSEAFEGFYYKAEIVSAALYTEDVATASEVQTGSNVTLEEQAAKAKEIYTKWNGVAEQLIKKSGRSLKDMPAGMNNAEQIKKFKLSVMESWKKADAALYAEYRSLQSRLGAAINGDPYIMRKIGEN